LVELNLVVYVQYFGKVLDLPIPWKMSGLPGLPKIWVLMLETCRISLSPVGGPKVAAIAPFKVIQGHRFRYQSNTCIQLAIP